MADLREQRRVTLWIDELRDEVTALLVNPTGAPEQISVFSSVCPHFGGEFAFDAKKCELRCLWHGWRFDPVSGACKTYKVATKLRHYDFEEHDGHLIVCAPA